ncbi:MAG: hypothetical protein LCH95_05790 [Proteobacteria bacterium]|nr:hypothetical protein [Pseudomonadota bacterium]
MFLAQMLERGVLMRNVRIAVAALMAATLVSCSPYNYSKSINDFSNGVSGLTGAVEGGHQASQEDAVAIGRRKLVYNQQQVTFSASCNNGGVSKPGEPPCVVMAVGGASDTRNTPAPGPRTVRVSKALAGYAQGLKAISNASDRTEFDAEVAKLKKSLEALAALVPGLGVGGAAAIGGGINLLGWLVGTGLDLQRYETLRKTVTLVNSPVGANDQRPLDTLGGAMLIELLQMQTDRRNVLFAEAAEIRRGLGPGLGEPTYRARLADLEDVLAKLEAVRKSDPTAAVEGMVAAHDALAKALNDPGNQAEAVAKAVGEFGDRVNAVVAATSSKASKSKN